MNSVSKISAGNLEQEVPVKSNDEIGLLSKSFNIMLKNLKDNIALTQNILEVMPILLIILDHNFKIIKCNSNVEIYFNVKLKEIEKKVLWEEIEFFDKYKHNCMDVLINSKPMHIPREAFKDKEESYYELYLYPLKIQSLNGVVLRLEDVTEAEKRDSQLRQAQKMETVGTLAGGLAHDFNNILCGIIGTVSMLKFKLFKDKNIDYELLNRYIDTIEQASNRAEDMVQQFLALSRKQELNFTKVDLNTCLKHVYKICKNTFDKCINLEVSYNPDQAYTLADMTQIEQVLLNLCINASHAMTIMKPNNQGGTLRLTIEIIETDKYIQKTHNEAIDNFYWKLSVSDTGVGIEKKNISKIFDPFFTTKDKGLGTGLGLAMVYNIIKQHNGFIELYTEIGEGTNIIVYLPVLKSDEITEQINIQEHEIFKGNKETILLVDDEMIIQQIGKEILEECNYNVIICSDGEEAILYYKNEHEYIDLVILDMLMPKKSGKDTFIEIKKINPNAKIILCSGFKQDNRVEKLFELGLKYFIQKPFSLYKLSKIVKDALNDIA